MATRKRDRFFALFFAILFLGTSSALAIAILVSNLQNHHQDNGATSTQNSNSNLLAGTKLANFTPVEKVEQLQATDMVDGTGDVVKTNDTLTLDYTGAIASTGIIFQSSKDAGESVTRPLTDFISGWIQGLPGMKAGGTRRLLIPAAIAYGASPPAGSGIPANADLVFDITVHSINKQ